MKQINPGIAALLVLFAIRACNTTPGGSPSSINREGASQPPSTSEASKSNSRTGASSVAEPGNSAQYISKQVVVKGAVEQSLTLTVADLKTMPVATLEDIKVVCKNGTIAKTDRTCKGVLLKDILQKAKIQQAQHKNRSFYIIARATDNYKAIFSGEEIFNSATGDNVYILFEENKQPITSEGEMVLISTSDRVTGPRHVRWLSSIEVNTAE